MTFPGGGDQGFRNTGLVIANQVVIFGPNDGVFVYNGNPQFGNPPVDWITPPGITQDPFGNVLPVSTGGFVSSSGPVNTRIAQIVNGTLNLYSGIALWSSLNLDTFNKFAELTISGGTPHGLYIGSGSNNTQGIFYIVPSGDTTGVTDRQNIMAAISLLSAGNGGMVVLMPGVFYRDSSIIIDDDFIILTGMGSAATNLLAATAATGPAVIVGNTRTLSGSGVKDFQISDNGGGGVPVAGSTHGVVFACNAGILENVVVQAVAGDEFHISQDQLQSAISTTITAGSVGALPQATLNVASTASFPSSGSLFVTTSLGSAYVTYTGTAGGNQFTGCTCNFVTGATLALNAKVIPSTQMFDLTATNCYAQKLNATTGGGWFIGWDYSSCEFWDCRASGGVSRPVATGSMDGWTVYGTQIKLFGCHGYFFNGFGLKLNDTNQFTGGLLSVTGGEWENNASGGMKFAIPSGPCWINPGTQFYGNGINTGQADILLTFGCNDINIDGATFRHGSTPGTQVAHNIFATAVNRINIFDCNFSNFFIPSAIEIFGSGVGNACNYVTIRNNTFHLTNNTSTAVLFDGGVFNSIVAGNLTDASIIEQVDVQSPDLNQFYNNTFNPAFGALLTLVGPSTAAWNNTGVSEYWQTVVLDAGWAQLAGAQTPQYRLTGDGNVQLKGRISHAALGAAVTINNGSPLPSAFQPAATAYYRSADVNAAGVGIDATGVLTAYPGGHAPTTADLTGIYSLAS